MAQSIQVADPQSENGARLAGTDGDDLLLVGGGQWTGQFQAVNGSGVNGQVTVSLRGEELTVRVEAQGLDSGGAHAMHIHGPSSQTGAPLDVAPPTEQLDADDDGFIELAEAEEAGGPVLLTLSRGETAEGGSITFEETFSLADIEDAEDLFPLSLRQIVIHGDTVSAEAGEGTEGEVDGTAGFKADLPVAVAELEEGIASTADDDGGQAQDDDGERTEGAVISAGNGNDRIIGGQDDDVLLGGAGDDVIAGGGGNDVMEGGAGRDRFIVGDGNDVIADFRQGEDGLLFVDTTAEVTGTSTDQGLLLTAGDASVLLLGVEGGGGAQTDALV